LIVGEAAIERPLRCLVSQSPRQFTGDSMRPGKPSMLPATAGPKCGSARATAG